MNSRFSSSRALEVLHAIWFGLGEGIFTTAGNSPEKCRIGEGLRWFGDGPGGGRLAQARRADRPGVVDVRAGQRKFLRGGVMGARAEVGRHMDKVEGARPAALPEVVEPELPSLVDHAPDGDGWLHEIKLDGYRILCRIERGRATLLSRNGNDWTERFPELARAAAALPVEDAILDGEVAALLPDGRTSLHALQDALSRRDGAGLVYFAFDLLHRDGLDLSPARLVDRKAALERLLGGDAKGPIRYVGHLEGPGDEVFVRACRLGLEGVVSKRADSRYRAGRSKTWLKTKCGRTEDLVIAGYQVSKARPGLVRSIVVASHDRRGRLVYAGKVGSGFTDADLDVLGERLPKLARKDRPIEGNLPSPTSAIQWVDPVLVAEIEYDDITPDGRLRNARFHGLREDKRPEEAVREVVQPAEPVVEGVRLTHADRVLYPGQGATKRDLVAYYTAVAEFILPQIADRPTTLVRCPGGLGEPCFYQKHVKYWAPEPVRRVRIQEKHKVGDYLVADSLAALVGLVQIGILEIHTWNSTVSELERPDRLVFDLDPDPDLPWAETVEAARLVRDLLADIGLQSFVKTTGGKGLHVVLPIEPGPSWNDCTAFARAVSEGIAARDRRFITTMSKAKRHGKIFLDWLRNVRGATAVSAYSPRAREGATVALPIAWQELGPHLKPADFNLDTVPEIVASRKADPWARYSKIRQALTPEMIAIATGRKI
jgi:bifunctional non-homologous end joining protein LigD